MITDVQEEKLVIISDLHIGNPFNRSTRSLVNFITWAADNNYSLCINGDGLEVAQSSFRKIAVDLPQVFGAFKKITMNGGNVYYTIGNHDIVLQHVMHNWEMFRLTPYLNIRSGDKIIRVEHGHIYDPFFMNYPNLYQSLTHIAGFFLEIMPSLYKLWIKYEQILYSFGKKEAADTLEAFWTREAEGFWKGACEVLERGYDAVVFGHTHNPGLVELENGQIFANSGSWMLDPTFLKLENGKLSMENWADISREIAG